MQTENKLFDDIGKLATSTLGLAQGLKEEVETLVRQRLERVIADLDVVPRDEFDALKALAVKLEEENAALAARVDGLEGGATKAPKKAGSTAKKTAGNS